MALGGGLVRGVESSVRIRYEFAEKLGAASNEVIPYLCRHLGAYGGIDRLPAVEQHRPWIFAYS